MPSTRAFRRSSLLTILASSTLATSAPAQAPSATPLYADWRMVARADVIVRARVTAPVKEIEEAMKSGPKGHVAIKLAVFESLKGATTDREIAFQYYPQDAPYQPAPRVVLALDGREALVCLVRVGTPEARFYLDQSPRSLVAFDADDAERVRKEVANQRRIANDFAKLPAALPDELAPTVRAMIARMKDKDTEAKAFRDLEALGRRAVPSTIRLMEDFQPLPIQQISLENKSPQAFEGVRHYGPGLVVDALDAILEQVTGEHFGLIVNGAEDPVTERERRATIDGWRIYLYYGCPKSP